MKKVLVADDCEDGRLLLSVLLRSWKYEVLEAPSEIETIALLQTIRPDMIISDLSMKTPDAGLKVLVEAKRLYPEVPVLVCSGDFANPPGIVEKLKKAGANCLLQKPYTPDELKQGLESFKLPTIGDVTRWFLETTEMPSTEYFDEWKVATVTLNRCLCAELGDNPFDLPADTEIGPASHQALLTLKRVAEKWER